MSHALRYMPDSPPPDDLVELNRRLARRWDAAQREYLDGEPARTVARRHGIPLSTFRYHANAEGWRRCDAEEFRAQAALSPPPSSPQPPTPPSPPCSSRGPIRSEPADGPPADDPERMDARNQSNQSGHDGEEADRAHPADAEPPSTPAPAQEEDDPDPAYAVLLGDARRHMTRAVRDGRPLDAQRWLKLMRQLAVLAEEEARDADQEARDAGVLVDLAAPRPFQALSDDDLVCATHALRRALDARAADKQAAERARQSAPDLDSELDSRPEKSLDSPPPASSPLDSFSEPMPSGSAEDPQQDDPGRTDDRDEPRNDGNEAVPPLLDERDEINGFYRSRPVAAP